MTRSRYADPVAFVVDISFSFVIESGVCRRYAKSAA